MKVLVIITTKFVLGGGLTNSYLNYYSQLDDLEIDFASNNVLEEDLSFILKEKKSNYFYLGVRSNVLIYRKKLIKVLKNGNYDCVHIHGNSSSLFLELNCCIKTKINNKIIHIHNTRTNHPLINRIFNSYINKNSDYRLACSDEAGKWIFTNKYIVMKNCINKNNYSFDINVREKIRKEYKIDDDVFLIGTIGRMNEQKNHTFLIENSKIFDDVFGNCKIMIVGTGHLEEEIKTKIYNLSLEDKFILTGFKSNTNDFYNAMDLFVFPSIFEGFGMVCVEAQLCGLACCVSNSVPSEVSMSDYCVFYNSNDVEDFKNKLLILKNRINLVKRNRLEMIAFDGLVDNGYDVESNVSLLKKIYRKEI